MSTAAIQTAEPSAATPLESLIRHVLTRYHDSHREELPELVALARKVERVHADHPLAPHGLADALSLLQIDLEAHMKREEEVLFPALLAGQGGCAGSAGALRHDHDFQEEALRMIAELTQFFTVPDGACGSWRALYAGTATLCRDLEEHMRVENLFLFPHADGAGSCSCGN